MPSAITSFVCHPSPLTRDHSLSAPGTFAALIGRRSDRLHGTIRVLLLSDKLALWGELSDGQIRELNPTLPGPFGAVFSVAGCSPQAYRIFRWADGYQLF